MIAPTFLLLSVLLAAPARARSRPSDAPTAASRDDAAAPVQVAYTVGVGSAYLGLGVNLSLLVPHLAVFAGAGVLTFLGGFGGGLRLFPSARDRGWYLKLGFDQLIARADSDLEASRGTSLGLGYRRVSENGAFALLGAGLLLVQSHFPGESWRNRFVPDIELAVGGSF